MRRRYPDVLRTVTLLTYDTKARTGPVPPQGQPIYASHFEAVKAPEGGYDLISYVFDIRSCKLEPNYQGFNPQPVSYNEALIWLEAREQTLFHTLSLNKSRFSISEEAVKDGSHYGLHFPEMAEAAQKPKGLNALFNALRKWMKPYPNRISTSLLHDCCLPYKNWRGYYVAERTGWNEYKILHIRQHGKNAPERLYNREFMLIKEGLDYKEAVKLIDAYEGAQERQARVNKRRWSLELPEAGHGLYVKDLIRNIAEIVYAKPSRVKGPLRKIETAQRSSFRNRI